MADETNEDDSWLYGSSTAEHDKTTDNDNESNGLEGEAETSKEEPDDEADGKLVRTRFHTTTPGPLCLFPKLIQLFYRPKQDPSKADDEVKPDDGDDSNFAADAEDSDKDDVKKSDQDDSDSEDDHIVVNIGDIKATNNFNIKQRGNLLAPGTGVAPDKPKVAMGKFSIEEFESVGTISGQLAHEFSIDSLDEKPWRKPGADITDYFNYGFNEETWRAYCERQKKMRLHESGVGMQGLQTASANAQSGNSNGK